MRITIKDLQTQKTHDIGENGAVLGRDKRSTDIPVRDESVSKQHARIYPANGSWLLEDLGSSNGTYYKNKTIAEPVELYQGAVFSLAQRQFEVVLVELPEDTRAEVDEPPGHDTSTGEDDDIAPPPAADDDDDDPDEAPDSGEDASSTSNSRPKKAAPAIRPAARTANKPAPRASAAAPSVDADDAAPSKPTVGYFLIAIPKAFAYFLAAVPLLIVNPVGTVRKGVQEQKIPAMSPVQLMAYAIPAFVFTTLLGQIFGFIAMLIGGHFSIGALIPGLPIAVAIGIVAGIVAGFVMHPLVRFVVTLLKGHSDERSRTNYAIMIFTVAIVAALPQAAATLLAAIPLPFISLLSPLLMLAATAIGLWVSYSWVRAFEMIKWVQYVVLVLGALAVLGTLGNFVNLTIASVRSLGSGGGGSAVAVAEGGEVELSAEQKTALENAEKGGMPAEQVEALRKSLQAQQAAIAAAQKAAAAATEVGKDDDKPAAADDDKPAAGKDDGAKPATDAKPDKGKDDGKSDSKDDSKDDAKDDGAKTGDDDKAADDDAADDVTEGKGEPIKLQLPKPTRAPAASEFVEFSTRREEVERAIRENPILIRDGAVLKGYQALLKRTYEIDGKFGKKKGKPWEDEVNARRRDLAVFEGTRKLVDSLHKRIYGD